MGTVTRPAGGYTPSNPITNTTKYQDDSAATSPRVAISSVKVDGDLNKAFDVLTTHDNELAAHDTRIDALEAAPAGVTSVGLTAPTEFTVSGSPVTTTGSLTFAKANQNANLVYSGPSSGGAAAPTFRALAAADLPAASDTAQGAVELATNVETQTGTDTARAITPAGLSATVIGMGQTWQNVTGSRVFSTTYTNSTGRPIQLVIDYSSAGAGSVFLTVTIAGAAVVCGYTAPTVGARTVATVIVPNGATYVAAPSVASTLHNWQELR
jgi:hypothetical protein